nr:uncharacterized protein LOC128687004 [Cherax quadricarinatus]
MIAELELCDKDEENSTPCYFCYKSQCFLLSCYKSQCFLLSCYKSQCFLLSCYKSQLVVTLAKRKRRASSYEQAIDLGDEKPCILEILTTDEGGDHHQKRGVKFHSSNTDLHQLDGINFRSSKSNSSLDSADFPFEQNSSSVFKPKELTQTTGSRLSLQTQRDRHVTLSTETYAVPVMLVFELGYGSNHFGFLKKEILVFYSTLETNVVNDKDFLVSCDSPVKPRLKHLGFALCVDLWCCLPE